MSVPSTAVDRSGFHRRPDNGNAAAAPPIDDVRIVTAGGRRRNISAHSAVLASTSPVFERMLQRPPRRPDSLKVIKIVGVPHEAVRTFVRLLYAARCFSSEEGIKEIGNHGMHLLVLSHVYQVGWLKRMCEKALAEKLTTQSVVDVLVLAQRCDAPWLYLWCMKLLSKDFSDVEKTEAWKFLEQNDPWLELDILHFIQDAQSMQKRHRKRREELKVYMELSEAMDCLQHICREGCTEMPSRLQPVQQLGATCPNLNICNGLQQLIRHFASCHRKKVQLQYGCRHCKRLWQLLRLHASICDDAEPCKVPLCMQFKQKMVREKQEKKEDGDHDMWRLLVKKVLLGRVISNLEKRKCV